MKETLLNKIGQRTLTCGVVGLGYVGLPLAVEKAKAGWAEAVGRTLCSSKSALPQGHRGPLR